MRVYVTLAGTEKKLRLRVPETWEEFMSVLRERFNISDDAGLELKDAGDSDFGIVSVDDFENDDKIVLHIIAGTPPAGVSSASTSAILQPEASSSAAQLPRPVRLHDDLNDLQVQLLTCKLKHLRMLHDNFKTSTLRNYQKDALTDFRNHGEEGHHCYKWINKRLFYIARDARKTHELTVEGSSAAAEAAKEVEKRGTEWLKLHAKKAQRQDMARALMRQRKRSRKQKELSAMQVDELVRRVQNYKRSKRHPWDATEEYLINAIQLWQRSELVETQTQSDDKLFDYLDQATKIVSDKPAECWSEAELRDAKLRANTHFTCCRLKGKSLHVILLGPAASGKSFSQHVLLKQLLPEALEEPVAINVVAHANLHLDKQYKHLKDWTHHKFDKKYRDETGISSVAGDASRLKHYLESRFGKLGNLSSHEAVRFPSQGVLVRTGGVTTHVLLKHLKYLEDKKISLTTSAGNTDYNHGLRMGNPVVFISIDGEIARNIEHDLEAREAIRAFKKTLRHVLQLLGFNTLEPTVHTDLVAESLKRHAEQNRRLNTVANVYPQCAFKVVLIYASYTHTKAAGTQRAIKDGKPPPAWPILSWRRGLNNVQAALNIRNAYNYGFTRFSTDGPESDYFDDNADFVIIDNQFGYVKQHGLYCVIPRSVKVSVEISTVKSEANFCFQADGSKSKPFKTASGLLGETELASVKKRLGKLLNHQFADGTSKDYILKSRIRHQGFLYKTRRRKWAKKFFVLQGGALVYYDTREQFEKNKLSPKRIVQLGSGPAGGKVTLMQGKQKLAPPAGTAGFIISNLPKMEDEVYHSSYSLCAPSTDERGKWIEAIEAVVSGAGKKVSQTSGADGLAKSAAPEETSFESRTLQRNASLADFMKIRKDAENNLHKSDDFAKERAAARRKDVAQAPPWLEYSFGQFLSTEMEQHVSPHRLFGILEIAQHLPWHNAVQSHKLKELRKVRLSQRLSMHREGETAPEDESEQAQDASHDAATDAFIAEMGRKLQSGAFTQEEHDRMVKDYTSAMTKSTVQRSAYEAMQAGEITAEQYEQILRVQAFRNPDDSDASELQEPQNETGNQAPSRQQSDEVSAEGESSADSLPEYLTWAYDKAATAEQPPVPPRYVLPSPTTISLARNDVVSSADNGQGRLKREVNKITRTWDVEWDDGVARDPYPESKLSKVRDTPGHDERDVAPRLDDTMSKTIAPVQQKQKMPKASKMPEGSAKGGATSLAHAGAPSPAFQPGDAVVSVAKSGTRKGKRGTLVELATTDPRKWKVKWDNGVPGKPYLESKLEKIHISNSVTTQKSLAKKTASRARPPKEKRSLKPGDSVISIATTGTRRGKRGRLVKLVIMEPRKWTVSWDDGVPGKPYPESKLKQINGSD